jgi:hypothetical protein
MNQLLQQFFTKSTSSYKIKSPEELRNFEEIIERRPKKRGSEEKILSN